MSPETHLLASWLIAAKVTRNPRDCRLATLAGVLPDLDGSGLVIDMINRALGRHETFFYQNYHHYVLHGIFGAVLISGLLAAFAREKWRVAWLAFLLVHVHLFCDVIGARGPTIDDIWRIFYLAPFTTHSMILSWKHQWRLDGWQNRWITVALFAWALWVPLRTGYSVVGVFSRRADEVFVAILAKWRKGLNPAIEAVARPPWRTVVPGVSLLSALAGGYLAWQPGLDERSGRDDLHRNGIWLSHGWLGGDEWFVATHKTAEQGQFHDPAQIRMLASSLSKRHIKDVFPHLCPSDPRGNLAAIDNAQAERFLTGFSGLRVFPWVGGPAGPEARYRDVNWRRAFSLSVSNLLASHPRFAGVHLNIEPMPGGDGDFLQLLEELRASLPRGKLLSVAAYPPPTWWHRFPDVHWDEAYFRQVARRCDQMVVMMYDTSLRNSKLYQNLVVDWTIESLSWSERKPVLLGIPTYSDVAAEYHFPDVQRSARRSSGPCRSRPSRQLPGRCHLLRMGN